MGLGDDRLRIARQHRSRTIEAEPVGLGEGPQRGLGEDGVAILRGGIGETVVSDEHRPHLAGDGAGHRWGRRQIGGEAVAGDDQRRSPRGHEGLQIVAGERAAGGVDTADELRRQLPRVEIGRSLGANARENRRQIELDERITLADERTVRGEDAAHPGVGGKAALDRRQIASQRA